MQFLHLFSSIFYFFLQLTNWIILLIFYFTLKLFIFFKNSTLCLQLLTNTLILKLKIAWFLNQCVWIWLCGRVSRNCILNWCDCRYFNISSRLFLSRNYIFSWNRYTIRTLRYHITFPLLNKATWNNTHLWVFFNKILNVDCVTWAVANRILRYLFSNRSR